MTVIRKMALKISNEVVIWASPGSKEWAEGLGRELAFIESDWAALGWSLGSIRVAFDRRELPIGSLDEVPGQLQKFTERFISCASYLWFPIFRGPESMFMLFRAESETRHFGSALIVFASITGLIFWLAERHYLKQNLTGDILDDAVASAVNYKMALRRQCSTIWIPAIALASFCVGSILELGGFRALPILNLIWILIGLCYVFALGTMQRNYQRRVERLDLLLAERSGIDATTA